MKIKFAPSTHALGGYRMTCVKYKRVTIKKGQGKRKTALRCAVYSHHKGKPVCHKKKRGGGRSKGLINRRNCR